MDQWLITTPYNNETIGSTGTSQVTITRSLPRSNFLGRMGGTVRLLGVGTPTLTIDSVKVLLNGSQAVLDTGAFGLGIVRSVQKYEQGSAKNGTLTSTTDLAAVFQYQFGRYLRDTDVILPAKLYRSVDLQLTFTPGAGTSVTSQSLDLWTEEFVSAKDPTSVLIKRLIAIDSRTPAASSVNLIDCTPGGLLRSLYLFTADLDNIGANGPAVGGTNGQTNLVRLIGNGSDIPYAQRADTIDGMMVNTYRFDDAAVPTGSASNAAVATGTQVVYKIDFDLPDNLARAIDTNRLNRLQLEYTTASSGASGSVAIFQEDVIPVIL